MTPTATATPLAAWTQPAGFSPAIWFDFFPTTVTFPATDRTYDKARIIVTAPTPDSARPNPRLYVFIDTNQGPGAAVIAEIDPDLIFGDAREGFDFVLTAPNPTPVHVQARPMHNCGCGSLLKAFRPFNAPRHTAAPAARGTLAEFSSTPGTPAP